MKYKINHWRCYWLSYKDTKLAFGDWFDNDYLGIILANFLYYVFSIALLPIFLILSFVWYIKRVYQIKKKLSYLDVSVVNTLKRRKIIKEIKEKADE